MSENKLFDISIGDGMMKPDAGPLKGLKARSLIGSSITTSSDVGTVIRRVRPGSAVNIKTTPGVVDKSAFTKLSSERAKLTSPTLTARKSPKK